jgi:ankyrin repeat protein
MNDLFEFVDLDENKDREYSEDETLSTDSSGESIEEKFSSTKEEKLINDIKNYIKNGNIENGKYIINDVIDETKSIYHENNLNITKISALLLRMLSYRDAACLIILHHPEIESQKRNFFKKNIDAIYQQYKADIENKIILDYKTFFENYFFKMLEELKETNIRPEDLNQAESLVNWQKTIKPIITILKINDHKVVLFDAPMAKMTKKQEAEFEAISSENPPVWFLALEVWEQTFWNINLKKGFYKNNTQPSTIRKYPGLPFFMQHGLLIYNNNSEEIFRSIRNRSSIITPSSIADSKEIKRLSQQNFHQFIKSEESLKNIEKSSARILFPRPVLYQTVLSPTKPLFSKFFKLADMPSEGKMEKTKHTITERFEEYSDMIQDEIKYKFISTNYAVNFVEEGRLSGVITGDQKDNSKEVKKILNCFKLYLQNIASFDQNKIIDLINNLESNFYEEKIFLDAIGSAKSKEDKFLIKKLREYLLLINQKRKNPGDNIEIAKLEKILIKGIKGWVISSCRSGKDRNGTLLLLEDVEYCYSFCTADLKSMLDINSIFLLLFKSGHQQLVASTNALGCVGLKSLKDILPELSKKIPPDMLELNDLCAYLNRVKPTKFTRLSYKDKFPIIDLFPIQDLINVRSESVETIMNEEYFKNIKTNVSYKTIEEIEKAMDEIKNIIMTFKNIMHPLDDLKIDEYIRLIKEGTEIINVINNLNEQVFNKLATSKKQTGMFEKFNGIINFTVNSINKKLIELKEIAAKKVKLEINHDKSKVIKIEKLSQKIEVERHKVRKRHVQLNEADQVVRKNIKEVSLLSKEPNDLNDFEYRNILSDLTMGRRILDKNLEKYIAGADKNEINSLAIFAIHSKNAELFRLIIEGINPNFKSSSNKTLLELCADNYNEEIFKLIIKEIAVKLNSAVILSCIMKRNVVALEVIFSQYNSYDYFLEDKSLLINAVLNNCIESCKLLIANVKGDLKALLEYKRPDGTTALSIAISHGFEKIGLYLLREGAEINYLIKNNSHSIHSHSLLQLSIESGTPQITQLILERGVTKTNINLYYAFHAVSTNNIDSFKRYLKEIPIGDINHKNCSGKTLLHRAVEMANEEILGLLLERSDLNINELSDDKNRVSALFLAIATKNEKFVSLLLNAHADPNGKKEICYKDNIQLDYPYDFETPLFFAAERNYLNICKQLVHAGANINLGKRSRELERDNITPLEIAYVSGHEDIVEFLNGEKNTDKQVVAEMHKSMFHCSKVLQAILCKSYEVCRKHLEKIRREDINIKFSNGKNGFSLLHMAVLYVDINIVKLLIDFDANVNELTDGLLSEVFNYHQSPLYFAVTQAVVKGDNDAKIAKLLLENGAEPIAYNFCKSSILMSAVRYGSLSACQLIIQKLKKLNKIDHVNYQTNFDCKKTYPTENVDQKTALFLAAELGRADICRLLLENGADPSMGIKNEDGVITTPRLIAAENGYTEVIELLREAEEKNSQSRQIYVRRY